MTTIHDFPSAPCIAEGYIFHARHTPARNAFSYPYDQWLIDLDSPPRLTWPASAILHFRAGDHLPSATSLHALRVAIGDASSAAGYGRPSRVLMLTRPSILGYVFAPLTIFYCFDAGGSLTNTVMEVRNTYGQRHNYVVSFGEDGRATATKNFYVSPFNDVKGEYTFRMRVTPSHVRIAIHLSAEGVIAMSTVARGTFIQTTQSRILSWIFRRPFRNHLVALHIRLQGVGLWLRGLRTFPRPH